MISAPESVPLSRRSAVRTLRLNLTLGVIVFALALVACTSPFPSSPSHARVRLHNDSPFRLEQVRFSSGTEPLEFGRLEAGSNSAYRLVSTAYRVAYVEAEIAGEIYASRAADFTSEQPLDEGTYTYRITVDSIRQVLHATFVED